MESAPLVSRINGHQVVTFANDAPAISEYHAADLHRKRIRELLAGSPYVSHDRPDGKHRVTIPNEDGDYLTFVLPNTVEENVREIQLRIEEIQARRTFLAEAFHAFGGWQAPAVWANVFAVSIREGHSPEDAQRIADQTTCPEFNLGPLWAERESYELYAEELSLVMQLADHGRGTKSMEDKAARRRAKTRARVAKHRAAKKAEDK